ncbi:endonuclease/exonuclease/phosphatase family protein [Marinospirillum insulare]|uniref:Metal-dependent hydrolase, endonuclease/exonuclease/phosphatase family n=1 Tax=Marinospirillum insulare TaxID=217169 RepID=A0ABQ5ZRM0_9GAMM|nr:endonuclease/exonuclease/phosphatase family protein [Marinospirillum insulare]GLR62796.1 hypothetical protein GCM10007878_02310 [Marinospirillum insulare]
MKTFLFGRWLASGLLVVCLLAALVFPVSYVWAQTPDGQGLVIASWNIERLGHGQNKDYEALGQIGQLFDFIAVQEAMTVEGLYRFQAALQEATGETWGMMYSHRIGRSTYKEKYAFVWRESRIDYLDGAVVYLDPGDLFAREPYSARFKNLSSGDEFAVATVHIVYGRRISDRTEEIEELARYWDWLHQIYPGTPVLLMGDFNLQPLHAAWQPLRDKGVVPLIVEGATTLSAVDGRFANLYDNIWVAESGPYASSPAGIVEFPALLGVTHEAARRHVSDHTPIYLLSHQAGLRGNIQADDFKVQPSAEESSAQKASDPLIGNRRSKILHRPDCPSYSRVGEANRVYFDTLEEAQDAGYRLAGNCP